MRRVRSSEPGAHILFDAGTQRMGRHIVVTVDEQIAVDGDVRKLLVEIRKRLAKGLIARAKPDLAMLWEFGPLEGDADNASTKISVSSSDGDEYLARNFDNREAEIVPAVIAEWSEVAIPDRGDGVGTMPGVDTSGGTPSL